MKMHLVHVVQLAVIAHTVGIQLLWQLIDVKLSCTVVNWICIGCISKREGGKARERKSEHRSLAPSWLQSEGQLG